MNEKERPGERIRVLVADDHPVFRRGMRAILSAEADTELVGDATDGEEAIALALELQPDVILMDLNMPRVTGIVATQRILEANPNTAILMLTMFEDDKSVFAAMRAGAHGYVLKGADGAETLRAIHAAASGEAIFSPTITQRLTEYFATPRQDHMADSDQIFPNLTEREHEILSYCRGLYKQRHRLSPLPEPQNRTQLRIELLHQAASIRSLPGDSPRAQGRVGNERRCSMIRSCKGAPDEC